MSKTFLKSFFKFSSFKNISKLGKITYGLYCLHFLGILSALRITAFFNINNQVWQVLVIETILALAISIAFSKLIYRYFESPFLQIKKNLSNLTFYTYNI